MGIRVFSIDGDTSRRTDEELGKAARFIQLLIPEKDKDAWSYAKKLTAIELHKASDQDHTLEDGSNEAAAKFLTMIENHRTKLEEEEERLRLEKEKAAKQSLAVEAAIEPAAVKDNVEGFTMFKLVEGRMLEYWLVPGKLPMLIGEVGTKVAEAQKTTSGTLPVQVQHDDDYQRLNGEDIPFFQPPSNEGH